MAVRVKVNVEFKNKKIEAVGLANAGYETDTEEILLPASLFRKYWKEKGKEIKYLAADERIITFKHVGKCRVRVITKDKISKEVSAELLISPRGEEAILSDALIQSLRIIFLKVKSGKWCFKGEDIERKSEPMQRW